MESVIASEAIVASAREDGAARFVRLYRELFPCLYGYIRYRVRDVAAAEGITAQVFEKALARLATVRDPNRARAWLFAVARNAVTDYRRRQHATADLTALDSLEHFWADAPEGEAFRREEGRRLAALTERERDLIGLRFAAGLANREIAPLVGLSESNVAQIVHRAILKLRARFDEEEKEG